MHYVLTVVDTGAHIKTGKHDTQGRTVVLEMKLLINDELNITFNLMDQLYACSDRITTTRGENETRIHFNKSLS